LVIILWSLFFLIKVFIWRKFVGIRIDSPTHLWFLFVCGILFHPFTFFWHILNLFIFFLTHLFICVYTVCASSPPALFPLPPPLYQPSLFQAKPILPFSPILLKRRHKQ
jgi:hypothetical protein